MQQRRDRSDLEAAADERRRRLRQRSDTGAHLLGRGQRRIVPEDAALELLQGRAGLEAELIDEQPPGRAVRVEGVLLPSRAVERENVLLVQALTERLFGEQLLELAEQRAVPPERELRIVPQFGRRQALVVQATRLGPGDRLPGEIGERRTGPESERPAEVVRRVSRIPRRERESGLGDQTPEALEVELAVLEGEPVARAVRLDPACPERLAQAVDIDL